MSSTWTPELRETVKNLYLAGEPTPENSTELLKSIADEVGQTVNGVRIVLTQEKVYVKKEAVTGKANADKKEGAATKRVGKDDLIAELREAITEKGADVDDDILTKLTGKAAAYFTSVLKA